MKNREIDDILFSDEVISFLNDAADFCEHLEEPADKKRETWFVQLRLILSRLYLSGLVLPPVESVFEESNQKFVSEETYNVIRQIVLEKAGQWDAYPEVFDPREPILEFQVTASVSEDIADIYQDIKDFLTLYHLGNHEVMNDALWEVRLNFEQYWGQKIVNVLRVIHQHIVHGDFAIEEYDTDTDHPSPDTSDWFITKRQKDFRSDDKKDPDDQTPS
jgi:hypothetical protein